MIVKQKYYNELAKPKARGKITDVFGSSSWLKCCERRLRLYNGRYLHLLNQENKIKNAGLEAASKAYPHRKS
jgi:hypothetical protein